jgi:hypothetical protein
MNKSLLFVMGSMTACILWLVFFVNTAQSTCEGTPDDCLTWTGPTTCCIQAYSGIRSCTVNDVLSVNDCVGIFGTCGQQYNWTGGQCIGLIGGCGGGSACTGCASGICPG